jgi:phosphoglycolate phosphatase
MYKKLVIFDLDGTLLDTLGDLTQSVNYALNKCGIKVIYNKETIRTFVGNGIGKLLERALPLECRNEVSLCRIRDEFLPYYNMHSAELTEPYPGIESLLQQLQERGFLLAIASNKYQEATERLVHHYFPQINFVCIRGQRSEVPVKPHPQIVLDIIKEAGVLPHEVLYIGDSGVDMQTAQNAQVDAVGVTWGFRSREELESYHPIFIIDTAEQIMSICLN